MPHRQPRHSLCNGALVEQGELHRVTKPRRVQDSPKIALERLGITALEQKTIATLPRGRELRRTTVQERKTTVQSRGPEHLRQPLVRVHRKIIVRGPPPHGRVKLHVQEHRKTIVG